MSRPAIITDLNRCVGCLACSVACKVYNNVPIGNYWNKVVRMGPVPKEGADQFPNVEMYFLPLQCQHCGNPECIEVCPVGATYKREDGVVVIDKDVCIGCQACVSACPYGVRYLDEDQGVVQKCNLCADKLDEGLLPQCVTQCGGRARYFGDLDEGLDSFEGPAPIDVSSGDDFKKLNPNDYEANVASRAKLLDVVNPFTDDEMYHLNDDGNDPSFVYILRGVTWQTDPEYFFDPTAPTKSREEAKPAI
jgi:DMSO reductase iron-sulfur subunit